MKRLIFPALTCAALLALPLPGQVVAGIVSPPVQVPGQPVSLTAHDATGMGLSLPSGCVVDAVRRGSPGGPAVWTPFCTAVITPIAPGGSLTGGWPGTDDFGNPVPPDMYYLRVSAYTAGFGTLAREWFPVDMRAQAPVLGNPSGQPVRGVPFLLDLQAPAAPGGLYLLAWSLTTNQGQPFGGLPLALDRDVLFDFSTLFPTQSPFTGGIGGLDATGTATGMGLQVVPAVPALAGARLHAQALVLAAGTGVPSLSNALSFRIN